MLEPGPEGVVVHRTRGRARLRFAALRGAEERLGALAARLTAIPGITRIAANPLTGSVVVHHRGDWESVAAAAARTLAIVWQDGAARAKSPAGASREVDLRFLMGSALGLLALLQLLRREVLPPALTLLWYAAALIGDRPKDN